MLSYKYTSSENFPLNSDRENIPKAKESYGLDKQQEAFLFGDQPSEKHMNEYFVFQRKVSYAREWLASHVPIEAVPEESVKEFADARDHMKEKVGDDIETYGVVNPHPAAFAMRGEHELINPSSRPVLFNAIEHTMKRLADDPLLADKINYVLDLFLEQERIRAQTGQMGGERAFDIVFPRPVL